MKKNKRGIGAEKVKRPKPIEALEAESKNEKVSFVCFISHVSKFPFDQFFFFYWSTIPSLGENKNLKRGKML